MTERTGYYESLAQGHRGNLVTRIGSAAPTAAPEGYWLAASGTGWSMYLSDNLSGITAPHVPEPAAPAVYGLDGRRCPQAPAAGVYVVNGTKRVVR